MTGAMLRAGHPTPDRRPDGIRPYYYLLRGLSMSAVSIHFGWRRRLNRVYPRPAGRNDRVHARQAGPGLIGKRQRLDQVDEVVGSMGLAGTAWAANARSGWPAPPDLPSPAAALMVAIGSWSPTVIVGLEMSAARAQSPPGWRRRAARSLAVVLLNFHL
jgi:hypothetical protein